MAKKRQRQSTTTVVVASVERRGDDFVVHTSDGKNLLVSGVAEPIVGSAYQVTYAATDSARLLDKKEVKATSFEGPLQLSGGSVPTDEGQSS